MRVTGSRSRAAWILAAMLAIVASASPTRADVAPPPSHTQGTTATVFVAVAVLAIVGIVLWVRRLRHKPPPP